MSGRWLAWGLMACLGVALGLALWRAGHQWTASRILNSVERITQASQGRLPRRLARHHLKLLDRAAASDPAQVGIPLAQGTQHLILEDHEAAIAAFEAGLRLEPRSEIYINLAQAHIEAGSYEEADAALRRGLMLDETGSTARRLRPIRKRLERLGARPRAEVDEEGTLFKDDFESGSDQSWTRQRQRGGAKPPALQTVPPDAETADDVPSNGRTPDGLTSLFEGDFEYGSARGWTRHSGKSDDATAGS